MRKRNRSGQHRDSTPRSFLPDVPHERLDRTTGRWPSGIARSVLSCRLAGGLVSTSTICGAVAFMSSRPRPHGKWGPGTRVSSPGTGGTPRASPRQRPPLKFWSGSFGLNIEPFALSVVQEKAPRGVGTAVANGQSSQEIPCVLGLFRPIAPSPTTMRGRTAACWAREPN